MKAANEVVQTPAISNQKPRYGKESLKAPEGIGLWQEGCSSLLSHFIPSNTLWELE